MTPGSSVNKSEAVNIATPQSILKVRILWRTADKFVWVWTQGKPGINRSLKIYRRFLEVG